MDIEVVRSDRRKKTVQARMAGDTLRIAIPSSMSVEEEAHWVAILEKKMKRLHTAEGIDLGQRAQGLAERFGLQSAAEISWSDRQTTLWGSCTPTSGKIRISNRIAAFPSWVLDYVIVHELAHLDEANHTQAFWSLVNRYQLAERARGYLLAKGAETD